MQIEFDPAKDALNVKNHGLSLMVASDLEWDLLSELVSVWTAEAENKLVDFVRGASSWKNCDRNSHLEVFLTFDFKVDWHVDELDRHAFKVDRLVHAEEAALLPRPVS